MYKINYIEICISPNVINYFIILIINLYFGRLCASRLLSTRDRQYEKRQHCTATAKPETKHSKLIISRDLRSSFGSTGTKTVIKRTKLVGFCFISFTKLITQKKIVHHNATTDLVRKVKTSSEVLT